MMGIQGSAAAVVFLFFSVAIFHGRQCRGQFPRVCAVNITLPNATCCPPPSDGLAPCGTPNRGICASIRLQPTDPILGPPTGRPQSQDDRLQWPSRFYKFTCQCRGNFWGYACHICKPGWTGSMCDRRIKKIRRNVLNLTTAEKRIFREVVARSKTVQSDWVVLNVTSSENGDPIDEEMVSLSNASVYDVMVFLHLYASRSVLLDTTMDECRPSEHPLDFAHRGPAFLTWHRLYLILFELELSAIAAREFNQTNFALPYWDWTGKGDTCDVCTNEIVGDFNTTDPDGRLDRGSSFFEWRTFCSHSPGPFDCHICDPDQMQPHLWRRYSTATNGSFGFLPTQEQVDATMTRGNFDSWPYNTRADNTSFRNRLEGFGDGRPLPTDSRDALMHNQVRMHKTQLGKMYGPGLPPNQLL